MKIKTNELIDDALDWAVAKCEGLAVSVRASQWRNENFPHNYSTDWAQGGPIIEREEISVNWASGQWQAHTANDQDEYVQIEYGPTPLIAAMRCYVASKLGDEVDVPEELCQPTA
jgi:hypothetical protein